MDALIQRLLNSDEAAVRLNLLVKVLGEADASPRVQAAREAVRASPRTQALLSECDPQGRIPGRAYFKWTGAHWVLLALSEMGYPPGDRSLLPLLEQEYDWFFSPRHLNEAYRPLNGRVRRCAAQEAVALLAALALGLFTLLASLLFHAFWAMPPEQQGMQQLMFMKNMAVAGGMFLLSAVGAGALSLDSRRTKAA
jgi:hypothetical protein